MDCHDQQKKSFLFVLTVDGILGKEALVTLNNLIRLIVTKIEEPLSQVRGWVNRWIESTVMRLYYRMILRASLPSPRWDQEPDWDLVLGLDLTP